MKKRILCLLLTLTMAISLLPGVALAAEGAGSVYTAEEIDSRYFYDQLNTRAKAIYDKLYDEFTGDQKESYYSGTKIIDLMHLKAKGDDNGTELVTDNDVTAYIAGNKDIFNDFTAAKDALDLDHPELWWLDSGYLTFRVTHGSAEPELELGEGYHVIIGPGRGPTYLLAGKTEEEVAGSDGSIKAMDEKMTAKIDEIVNKAKTEAAKANEKGDYSEADQIAALVRSVHDQITVGLSYRYETDCENNEGLFIRTIYAMNTKKGVCEAYSRTLQVCLSKLGIPCVLIHGLQTKGTPEDHMWNAVRIDDGETERWYAVDATWDDPVSADYQGVRDTSTLGKDDKENTTYLLVGQNVIGEYWHPSGYVSTGTFEFEYPKIETSSFNGSTAYGSSNGLKVEYSAGSGSMEDGTPAGVFTVTFEGKNMTESAKAGHYFMLKMYDYHPDGTVDAMGDWYYAAAAQHLIGKNPYFGDTTDGLRVYTATCEYVEVAVTTRKPQSYDKWADATDFAPYWLDAYYNGTDEEIIAQSGLLYNTNSSYEAPPYVFKQTPIPNAQATAGYEYRFDVTFDDELYHPVEDAPMALDTFTDNSAQAAQQQVRVRYITIQQDLHTGGDMVATITGDLPFDTNRDNYVDMPNDGTDNDYVKFEWHYVYADNPTECPNAANHAPGEKCDVNKGCRIDGVSFNFRASDMWQDDITQYDFQIEGVVGSRSKKFPNTFGVTAQVPGLCPACYRSQGIDWNLWGKPTLLDAPENLDLKEMAKNGGTDSKTLEKLDEEINKSGLNGRLMLVVEDKTPGTGNREAYEEIENALEDSSEGKKLEGQEVVGRSVFEINFNRICPMVKLKPGQSLRVQVGYPAGITYEMLTGGDSSVELKAYHFTRCDSTHKCDEYNKAGHKDGEHIVGVNEITMIPTPYGMVIMCDSFSPFEVVAIKKDASAVAAAAETAKEYTVVVVEGANGSVKLENADSDLIGAAGNLKIKDGESRTFTVTADEGYTVDSVAIGGVALKPDESGKYKITAGEDFDSNDVLSATFVPTSTVIEGQETLVSKTCTHSDPDKIKPVEEEGKDAQDATCTEKGYVLGTKCEQCGTQLTYGHEIPALGHQIDESTAKPEKSPTCTETGTRAYAKCSRPGCNKVISDGQEIDALGHLFNDYYKDEGVEITCQGTQKTSACGRAGCDETDTRRFVESAVDHSYKYEITTPASCDSNEKETGTCEWCGAKTAEIEHEGTQLKHIPDASGNGICETCGKSICNGNHTSTTIEGKKETCTEDGYTEKEVCSVCGYVIKDSVVIEATGHHFEGEEIGSKCRDCDQTRQTTEHTPEPIPAKAPTCTEPGYADDGERCSGCGQITTRPTTIPATGHTWKTYAADVKWTWSTEGTVFASVTLTCETCGETETFAADKVTEGNVNKEATCEEHGTVTYTAEYKVNDTTLTDTNDEVPTPLGTHKAKEGTTVVIPANCAHHGTTTYTCEYCEQEIVETTDTELKEHQFALIEDSRSPATCTEPGKLVAICQVCGTEEMQEDATIPALGHSFGSYRVTKEATCTENGRETSYCSRCGASTSRTIKATGHKFEDGVCTVCGEKDPDYKAEPWVNPFPDVVPEKDWFAPYLETVTERELFKGDENGNFNPNMDFGRAQLMTVLARLDGVNTDGGSTWYQKGMEWAVANKISDGTNPEAPLTREQFVTMLYRFMKSPKVEGELDFPDTGTVDSWASDAMIWAVQNGIIEGLGDGTLSPLAVASRAQAVTIISRFLEKFDL